MQLTGLSLIIQVGDVTSHTKLVYYMGIGIGVAIRMAAL